MSDTEAALVWMSKPCGGEPCARCGVVLRLGPDALRALAAEHDLCCAAIGVAGPPHGNSCQPCTVLARLVAAHKEAQDDHR